MSVRSGLRPISTTTEEKEARRIHADTGFTRRMGDFGDRNHPGLNSGVGFGYAGPGHGRGNHARGRPGPRPDPPDQPLPPPGCVAAMRWAGRTPFSNTGSPLVGGRSRPREKVPRGRGSGSPSVCVPLIRVSRSPGASRRWPRRLPCGPAAEHTDLGIVAGSGVDQDGAGRDYATQACELPRTTESR